MTYRNDVYMKRTGKVSEYKADYQVTIEDIIDMTEKLDRSPQTVQTKFALLKRTIRQFAKQREAKA